ncbi:MAG: hypothetical protein LH629_04115, partial [Ignavibacteria bacterium]|nr:hypothetical protein [Ignavibacteria bacterium]
TYLFAGGNYPDAPLTVLIRNENRKYFDYKPEKDLKDRDVCITGKIELVKDHYEALKDADALVIATEWLLFRTPDFKKMAKNLKAKVIFDGRNLYDLNQMNELGYYYRSIGRKEVTGKK